MAVRLWTLLMILLPLSLFSQDKVIRIAVYDTFPPFSFQQDGKMSGIYPDALKILLEDELGLTLEVTGYPWARAQLRVREGTDDGFVTVPTPERLEYVVAADVPLAQGSVAVYTGSLNPQLSKVAAVSSLEEIFQFPLVTYRGNGWLKDRLPPTSDVTWVTEPASMLPMLSTNRPFVAVDSEPMMDWLIKSSALQGKIIKTARFNPVDQFLCIGKNSRFAPLLPRMEEAIRRMQADGRLKAVLDRYR